MADLEDTLQVPSPEGGWSTRIRTVEDAVVAPVVAGYLVHEAGVLDASGDFVHEAVLWRGRALLVPPPGVPEAQDTLPGRWVWGGVLIGHFGHFLTESTGRLWALDAITGAVDGLVYIARRDVQGDEIKGFHKYFLEMVGIDLPVRIIRQPTRVEVLEVPGQGFGIGPLMSGTEPFRRFVQTRFARDVAPQGPGRLYISRSELSVTLGGILEEKRLEQYLAASGYEIFHPQNHSLPEQIARYKAARQIVALDGSALHLFAMVGRADQQVAMVKRRISNGSNGIIHHLGAFTGREPLIIDAILRHWVRSDRRGVDNYSFGELDFARLGAELGAAGFVPKDAAWPSLSEAEANAAVRRIETRLKRKQLTFAPAPRGNAAEAAEARQQRLAQRAERLARRAAAAGT